MIRRFILIILGAVTYLAFLAMTLPAKKALGLVSQQLPTLKVQNINGTIWSAHASHLQLGSFKTTHVEAGLQLFPLLAGNINIHSKLTGPGYKASAIVAVNNKTLSLSNLIAEINADLLNQLAHPGVRLSGIIKLTLKHLTIKSGNLQHITGAMTWHKAMLNGPLRLDLGKLTLKFKTRKNKISGVLSNTGSANQVKGTIKFLANSHYYMKLYFTPATLSAEQRSWLLTVGKAGPGGSFQFIQKGRYIKGSKR